MHSAACTLAPVVGASARAPRSSPASSSRPFTSPMPQRRRLLQLARAEDDSSSEQTTQQVAASAAPPMAAPPAAPQQQQEEEPIWVRRERERQLQKQEGGGGDLPFGAYLLFSSFTAIAAVGSIFEYANKKPVFNVIQPDSPLYTPILGLLIITGLPTSAFLFYKAVQSANKEAERMDKLDGY